MAFVDKKVSRHYLGKRGKKYHDLFPESSIDLARKYQASYFKKFCSDQLVLLDFGCANGLMLRCLPARERIGIEVNPYARKACIEQSKKESIPIVVLEGLDPVQSNYVDVVISNHCLEHVLDPYNALCEILRVLKPGGTLVLALPYDDFRAMHMQRWAPNDVNNHLYTWTPMLIGNLLTEVGFKVEFTRIYARSLITRKFWVRTMFGDTVFRMLRYLICTFRHRREVLCVAKKNSMPQSANSPL